MSPWVATTRLSLVATMTLQPVPQNRQGALFHSSSLALRSVTTLAADAATGIPAAVAAIAAAFSLSSWRRSTSGVVIAGSPGVRRGIGLGDLGGVKHQRSRVHMRQQRNGIERG